MAHLFNKAIYYIENGTDPNVVGLLPTEAVGLAKTEDGSSTWRYDDALPTNKWVLERVIEERICLNTSTPVLTPVDLNNPLVSEVDLWAIANLTTKQRENGTKLVYFVSGDGGSCDVPDYEWTLNGGEVTLSNKRVFNSKTVYVDAGSGSDVTGRRGYREYPFKTLDAAIAVLQDGDLLKVFPGDYTQGVPIATLFNIDCDLGVSWTIATGVRMFRAAAFNTVTTVNWSFDKLLRLVTGQENALDSNVELNINLTVNYLKLLATLSWKTYGKINYKIKETYNCGINTNSQSKPSPIISDVTIDYAYRESLIMTTIRGTSYSVSRMHIKNLKSINSATGYGSSCTIGYYDAADTGDNKQYTTIIDNVTHDDPNIYVTPPAVLSSLPTWGGSAVGTNTGQLVGIQALRSNSILNITINNLISTGNVISLYAGAIFADNSVINISLKGIMKKGIPIYLGTLNHTNTKIKINVDIVCETQPGIIIETNLASSNSIEISGRIVSKYAGTPCITVLAPLQGTLLLKDLTLINDGTVNPIMTSLGSPENVMIQNVTTNSLITDANIIEVGQSIIRNTNYK